MKPGGKPPGPELGGLGVTCLPHAATITAVKSTREKPNFRIMPSSLQVRRAIAAALGAFALAAAFPKLGAAWIVPFGAASLFWAWQGASWTRAALLGLLAGLIFFSLDYSWVGYTVSHYVGRFGPLVPIGPAIIEAPFLAAAGALAAAAYARARPSLSLAAAAAFTICERPARSASSAPFDQLGYTQADGPLRDCGVPPRTARSRSACSARILRTRSRRTWRRSRLRARRWESRSSRGSRGPRAPPPTIRVAAIQGNIAQSLKFHRTRCRSP